MAPSTGHAGVSLLSGEGVCVCVRMHMCMYVRIASASTMRGQASPGCGVWWCARIVRIGERGVLPLYHDFLHTRPEIVLVFELTVSF